MPIGVGVGISRHIHGASTGGSTALKLGLNVHNSYYGTHNLVENDLRFGDYAQSMPSGAYVPAAKMTASRWPNALPGTDTKIRYVFALPETSSAVDVLYTGPSDGTWAAGVNCTINTNNPGHLVVTPSATQPTDAGWALDFTPGASNVFPVITSAIPQNVSGTYTANALAHIPAITGAGGPLRTMKRSGVEANEGVTVSNTGQANPAALITSSNRNTTTSGNLMGSGTLPTNVPPNDGTPMEWDISLAVAEGRPLWRCLPWNADNTYYDAIGDLAAQAAINNGLTTYFEVSNEVWNGGYLVFGQARYEGMANHLADITGRVQCQFTGSVSGTVLTVSAVSAGTLQVGDLVSGNSFVSNTKIASLGTGTGGTGTYNLDTNNGTIASEAMVCGGGYQLERHIQKTIQVMQRIKARYVAAGADLNKLKRVWAWQNAGIDSIITQCLAYTPPSLTALSQNIDVVATAPYLDQGSVASSDTTVADWNNQLYNNMDSTIDTYFAAVYTACQATTNDRGNKLETAAYEGGQSLYIDDATTRSSVQTGSEMYNVNMHMYARLARVAPGTAFCNFCFPCPDFSNQSFGILHYSNETISASTPKYNAMVDFNAGKRKLITLSGSLATTAGATAGTVIGTLKRRTPGSTITLQSNPSGAVAITDATAQVLQFTVANASSFASSGTVNITVRETDARDPSSFVDTAVAIAVTGTAWDSATANATHITLSNSNLTATFGGSNAQASFKSTNARTTAYAEFHIDNAQAGTHVGIIGNTFNNAQVVGDQADGISYWMGGAIDAGGGNPGGTYATYTTGDIIMVCVKGGNVYFGKNGVWQNSANPSAGTGGISLATYGITSAYAAGTLNVAPGAMTANFGGSAFTYTPPTGTTNWL